MMTIAGQALSIADALKPWAQSKGGTSVVVSDLRALWEGAFLASDKPRILVCYAGETARGDVTMSDYLHRVDREWAVAICRGRGFLSPRGSSLANPVSEQDQFYDLVEKVRDIIRSLQGISEEPYISMTDIQPMNLGEIVVDGYIIRFTTANDLPQILPQPDSLQPSPLDQPA